MSPGQKKQLTVIAKPTHDCNLGCEYCYIDPNTDLGRMSETTLWNMTSKVLDIHDSVRFIWHGGEPFLMPLSFYERAVEFQRRYPDRQVINNVQTNGTLVTDETLYFCERYGFNIGYSLDGTMQINDATRHTKDGKSVFDSTMTAIKKSQKRNLGCGVLVVVNRTNKDHLVEFYEFAKREGINIKVNPLIKAGKALQRYDDLGIGPLDYGKALVGLFDIWLHDRSPIRLDPFDDLIEGLLTRESLVCSYSVSCQNHFISVGPQGNIYPCDKFVDTPGFYMGNINTDDLNEVLTSERRKWLRDRAERIHECLPCEYRPICNAGCMHNAYMQTGDIDTRDYYCASYKLLFSHVKKMVEAELVKAEVK